MYRVRRANLKFLSALVAILVMGLGMVLNLEARADHRPFPKYEMTFQKIVGKKDPNWSPGDPGDGCLREPNPKITHLTTFGFSTVLNQCDAVRTKIRFYLAEDSPGSPTLQFRFGVTWQYWTEEKPGYKNLILKPVENFTYDGKSVPKTQYDPDNPTEIDSAGNPVRFDGGTGMFEPFHYVFEDTFGAGEEHTIQFDSYLPADGGWAGMSWGTGSTGDTSGGSIGATANGLFVSLPAKMDFRYVLHSEYLAARGFAQDAVLTKDYDLPGLPERKWADKDTGVTDTTFELIQCLEAKGQQLAKPRKSIPVNKIYPNLPFDTPTLFENTSGSYGFTQWPFDWYIYQDGDWDPKTGLRPMNRNSQGGFDPYFLPDGTPMALPYKPTVESLIEDIPGYEYVDNDITIMPKGKFDLEQPTHSYNFLPAPNVYLRKFQGLTTQHFYYTYRPIPGTFELEKSAVKFDWDKDADQFVPVREGLADAEFELYEVVKPENTPCGLAADLTGTEKVTVCDYKQPNTPGELQQMLAAPATGCHEENVRKVTLAGTNGSFKTDANGKFQPQGDPALAPGDYLLREVSAPQHHLILNEWIPFNIPIQDDEHAGVVAVRAENYPLGSFELEKSGIEFQEGELVSKPLEGAEFALYQLVPPAEVEFDSPDPTDPKPEEVTVCEYRKPTNAAELKEMLASKPQQCQTKVVRKINLDGAGGSFKTDADGKFTMPGVPTLVPGDYLLRELAAPGEYRILNEWIPFTVYHPAGADADRVTVFAENYLEPPVPPEPTPTPTSTPPIPVKPKLPPNTGAPGPESRFLSGTIPGLIGSFVMVKIGR